MGYYLVGTQCVAYCGDGIIDLDKEGGYSEDCEVGFTYTDIECIDCHKTPKKVLAQVNLTSSNGLVLTFNSTFDDYELSTLMSIYPRQTISTVESRSGNQLTVDIEYSKDIYGGGRDILSLWFEYDHRIFIVD